MRVMVFVKATEESETEIPASCLVAGGTDGDGPVQRRASQCGILLLGDGLKPTSQAKRVAFDGPGRTVIDGPSPKPANWCRLLAMGRERTWTRPWPG